MYAIDIKWDQKFIVPQDVPQNVVHQVVGHHTGDRLTVALVVGHQDVVLVGASLLAVADLPQDVVQVILLRSKQP